MITISFFFTDLITKKQFRDYILAVRNIPLPTTATGTDHGGATDNDEDPLFTPPNLDSR